MLPIDPWQLWYPRLNNFLILSTARSTNSLSFNHTDPWSVLTSCKRSNTDPLSESNLTIVACNTNILLIKDYLFRIELVPCTTAWTVLILSFNEDSLYVGAARWVTVRFVSIFIMSLRWSWKFNECRRFILLLNPTQVKELVWDRSWLYAIHRFSKLCSITSSSREY